VTHLAPPAARSLRRNLSSSLVGNGLYAAGQFGMLSALAHLTSVGEVGRYALAFAVTGPVFILLNMKLRQVQATDAAGEFSFGHYLGLRLVTVLLAVGVVGCALAGWRHAADAAPAIAAVSVLKGVESVLDLYYGAMQRHEQLQLVARSLLWRATGGPAVFGVVAAITGRADAAVAALAALTAARALADRRRVAALGVRTRPSFDRAVLWRLTRLALPLAGATVLSSLSVNVTRYFVQAYESATGLGVYAALASLTVVGGTAIASVSETITPRLATHYRRGEMAQFRRIMWRSVILGAAFGVACVLAVAAAGGPFLRLVYGAGYARHTDVLLVLVVAASAGYLTVFFGTAVTAMRGFRAQLPLNVAGFAVILVVSAVLVPGWGILGAAYATLAGTFVSSLLYVGLCVLVVLPATRPAPPA
jgi:O-antigen/teichoic acid export membrane protein